MLRDSKDSIKIKNIRKMRNKGLVMELDSNGDVEVIKKIEFSKIGLRTESPKKFRPSIIIYDRIDRKLTKSEIVEQLWVKNLKEKNVDVNRYLNSITFKFSKNKKLRIKSIG